MEFIASIYTNPGGREINEDYAGGLYRQGSYGAWVVADGLGGHSAGERASKKAVDAALAEYERQPAVSVSLLECMMNKVNQAILDEQASDRMCADMRTTFVGLFVCNTELAWVHVGDSRLYWFRSGTLLHQTKDHSVSQMAVSSGEITLGQIRHHEDRNRLLRVLGSGPDIRPEIHAAKETPAAGDAFLLCTDGFWEYVKELEMELDLSKSLTPEQWLKLMCVRLCGRVDGDHDNYTAAAVFVL
ncbi:MAG: serine/threonine protein phosphatase [Paenibacillaceae bacterium]|nr:serine/threonine protein phosphatase [Paenibacillaceae bacterium]